MAESSPAAALGHQGAGAAEAQGLLSEEGGL